MHIYGAADGEYSKYYVEWLTAKLTAETARADKAEADRDELIGLIQGRHIMQYLDDVWEVLDTAINRIRGE